MDPSTYHKYQYAGANPIGRWDPTGRYTLTELLNTIAVGLVLYKAGLVLVASILYGREPDALGFGVVGFVGQKKGGPRAGMGGMFLAGLEVIYAPRTRQVAWYFFGGLELLGELDVSTPPHLSEKNSWWDAAFYEAWFWGIGDLGGQSPEAFFVYGASAPNGVFLASELEGHGTYGLLFGVSRPGIEGFAIGGPVWKIAGPLELTRAEMSLQVGIASLGASFVMRRIVTQFQGFKGSLITTVLNGVLTVVWANWVYNKPAN